MPTVIDTLNNFHMTELTTAERIFIYDLMCLQQGTDEDLDTYIAYQDKNASMSRLIRETAKACRLFKAQCAILRQELPDPSDVTVETYVEPGHVFPKVRLFKSPPKQED